MKHAFRTTVLGLAAGVTSALLPVAVFAQGVVGNIQTGLKSAATPAGYTAGTTDLPTIVGRLIGAALTLLGSVLLVYILYGGFLWMTAGGEDKKVTEAKNVIKNAVIGLVIIAAAFAISNFILGPQGLGYVFGGATASPAVTPAPGA